MINYKLNNKGVVLVEAAIVMPIVTLALVGVIYILMNLYNTTSLQSAVHITCEKGSRYFSETIEGEEDWQVEATINPYTNKEHQIKIMLLNHWVKHFNVSYTGVETYVNHQIGFSQMVLKYQEIHHSPLLSQLGQKVDSSWRVDAYYVHDEAEYIRNIDLLEDAAYAAIENIFDTAKERYESMELD